MVLSSEVLPAPEGPMSAMLSPWMADKEIWDRAVKPLLWVRPTSSSMKLMRRIL